MNFKELLTQAQLGSETALEEIGTIRNFNGLKVNWKLTGLLPQLLLNVVALFTLQGNLEIACKAILQGTSFATKLHFFLGVFFHFIIGADSLCPDDFPLDGGAEPPYSL